MKEVYWVCAVDNVSMRPIVQGWHRSPEEARAWGYEHLKGIDFEVQKFDTIDRVTARDKWKNILLERSNNLPIVFKRAIYPKEAYAGSKENQSSP